MKNLTSRGQQHYAHWICDQCQTDAYLRQPIKNFLRMREVPQCPYCNGTMQLKKPESKTFYQKASRLALKLFERLEIHIRGSYQKTAEIRGVLQNITDIKDKIKQGEYDHGSTNSK